MLSRDNLATPGMAMTSEKREAQLLRNIGVAACLFLAPAAVLAAFAKAFPKATVVGDAEEKRTARCSMKWSAIRARGIAT